MRPPDWASERGALDERGTTGRARAAGEDLRQRLDRLPDSHPSSPEYEELPGYGEHGYGEPEYGEPEYGEHEYGEHEYGEEPGSQDSEPAGRPEPGPSGPGRPGRGRPETGRPPGSRAGEAGAWPPAGTGGLAGRAEPYRPWFTAGESPEPWFTADPGD